MRKAAGCFLGILLLVMPVRAEQPQGRIVEENWHAVQINGGRVGHSHLVVREIERDGEKVYVTNAELKLSLKREGRSIELRMDNGTEENGDGKVSRAWARHYQGVHTTLRMDGAVKDGAMEITVTQMGQTPHVQTISWNDQVIGLYRQQRIFQDRKVKPGDEFSFVTFEPMIAGLLTNRVTVKEYEEVLIPAGKKAGTSKNGAVRNAVGEKQRLLRVEEVPDKVEGPQGPVQLPGMTTWLGSDFRPVCSEFEMPLLGKMKLVRADKSVIGDPLNVVEGPEILVFIPLNRRINRSNETQSAIYRITLKGDKSPGTAFAKDDRQTAKNVNDDSFDLHIDARALPRSTEESAKVKDEYLKSCFFINSEDTRVQDLTRRAVQNETDPWAKARLIERWVHANMEVNFTREFCPAGDVARRLSGDCRQHAMLAAAMCRAAGVPSRTAIGLVYAPDRQQQPGMAFHMWTEVFIDGVWRALDATRGEGHVGATHLKITDCSWFKETSLRPLLPVLRVTDKEKLSIKVVRVDYGD